MANESEPRSFIGIDMVDGCRPLPRLVDIAVLDRALRCRFDTWAFDPSGAGLFPNQIAPPGFVLAIDGPQGLAAQPSDRMRQCEREGASVIMQHITPELAVLVGKAYPAGVVV